MQFIKKTSSRTNIISFVIKLAFVLVITLGVIFLLNKIDFLKFKKNRKNYSK